MFAHSFALTLTMRKNVSCYDYDIQAIIFEHLLTHINSVKK